MLGTPMRRSSLATLLLAVLVASSGGAAYAGSRLGPARLISEQQASTAAVAAIGKPPGRGSWTVTSARLEVVSGPVLDFGGRVVVDGSTRCAFQLGGWGSMDGPGLLTRLPGWPPCGDAAGASHPAWIVELADDCGRLLCATGTVQVDAVHGLPQSFAVRLLV